MVLRRQWQRDAVYEFQFSLQATGCEFRVLSFQFLFAVVLHNGCDQPGDREAVGGEVDLESQFSGGLRSDGADAGDGDMLDQVAEAIPGQ